MSQMTAQKVMLSGETMKRIHELREEISKEMDYAYGVDDLINMALTALEDVRQG